MSPHQPLAEWAFSQYPWWGVKTGLLTGQGHLSLRMGTVPPASVPWPSEALPLSVIAHLSLALTWAGQPLPSHGHCGLEVLPVGPG